jgi:hypothetical protein
MSDLKRFLWQKHDGNTYMITDTMTGKEFFVNKTASGKFHVDGCALTDINCYGQEIPHFFKNKFEVMEYLKEESDTND